MLSEAKLFRFINFMFDGFRMLADTDFGFEDQGQTFHQLNCFCKVLQHTIFIGPNCLCLLHVKDWSTSLTVAEKALK